MQTTMCFTTSDERRNTVENKRIPAILPAAVVKRLENIAEHEGKRRRPAALPAVWGKP